MLYSAALSMAIADDELELRVSIVAVWFRNDAELKCSHSIWTSNHDDPLCADACCRDESSTASIATPVL